MAPRGGFRVPFGDSNPSRIVHSISQANYRPPIPKKEVSSAANLRQALGTITRRTRSITRTPRFAAPSGSGSSLRTVPLSSPSITRRIYEMPARSVVSESPYKAVAGRVANLARSGATMVSRVAARVVAALGPVGVAIALAVAAAAAIGAVIYYFNKPKETQSVPEAIDEAIDESLPPDLPENVPDEEVPKTAPEEPWNEVPQDEGDDNVTAVDPWMGNVPWKRRPGYDLPFDQVLKLHPALQAMAIAA